METREIVPSPAQGGLSTEVRADPQSLVEIVQVATAQATLSRDEFDTYLRAEVELENHLNSLADAAFSSGDIPAAIQHLNDVRGLNVALQTVVQRMLQEVDADEALTAEDR